MALAAPSLAVSYEPERAAVRIDATPPAGAEDLTIWRRSPSGNEASVRGWAPGDVTGSTPVIARDYEAPLGIELAYYARASDGTTPGAVAGPATITLPASACAVWLVDLARPVNSLEVEIESFEELHYEAAVGVHRVLGRRAPVLTSLPSYTPEGELNLLTDDETQREAVRALLGSGFPFLLRTSPALGIGNLYCGMLDLVEGRILPDGREPYRRFRVSIVQVERPDPALFEPAAPNTWANVESDFTDWAEVLGLAWTWDQVGNTYPANPWASPVVPWLPDDV